MNLCDPLEVGTKVDNYEVLKYIDSGCYGSVYYVRDIDSNKVYAMKIESLKRRNLTINKENHYVEKLNDPRIVKILDHGKTETFIYIIEEPLGPSLLHYMKNHKVTTEQAIEIGKESLLCLKALHENSLCHNDYKPANICLRPRSNAPMAVIDFGLSFHYRSRVNNKLLKKKAAFGTKRYAPPKSHLGESVFPCDDLISWSYVLLQLFGKKLPWYKATEHDEILQLKLESKPKKLCQGLPKPIEQILTYIFELAPNDQIDYDEIIRLLNKCHKLFKPKPSSVWEGLFKQIDSDLEFVPEKTTQLEDSF